MSQVISQGLENVIATETVLSEINGAAGELLIAGLPLKQVVELDYASTAHLLWAPFQPELSPEKIHQALGHKRVLAYEALKPHLTLLQSNTGLEAERLALELTLTQAELQDPIGVTALLGMALVLYLNPHSPEPEPDAEHSQDILRLIKSVPGNEQTVNPIQIRAFSTYLQTVAEHGLNASTFTARVIASTQSDLSSCLIGAIGALKGPLHGGAPGPVLDMLDAIGSVARAKPWISEQLAQHKRIMGFGHRVYRSTDPRAEILKATLKTLQAEQKSERLHCVEQIEEIILETLAAHKPERPLKTNVEYYTALLLEALGFERQDFTAVFALGRVLGWCAHIQEQVQRGRLLRPRAQYIGPRPIQAA